MEGGGRTVLVVDDDASIRFLCRINLELEGWTVRDAATLDDARAVLAAGAVAVVLLDVHIGTDSGLVFLEDVRAQHPSTAVVLLTGSVGTPELDGATADGIVAKPFRLEELVEAVAQAAG